MTGYDNESLAADCAETIPRDLTRLDKLDGWDVAENAADPRGFDVIGSDGDKIGTIDALLASPSTEKAYFAVVKTGGWFANRQYAIPLTMVTLRDGSAYLPITKGRFNDAPEWQEGSADYDTFCAYCQGGRLQQSGGTAATATPRPMAAGMSAGAMDEDTMEEGTMDTRMETAAGTAAGEMRVPMSEETVSVSKTLRPAGYITLRKREEEFTKHISEPVTRTDVSVETRDVRPGETFDEDTPTLRAGETLRVPVMEEVLNVETTPEQVTREVVVETRPRTETVERDVTLRREVVDVDEEGDINLMPPGRGTNPGAQART
jgi:uncharacterized protein (TIGR02271 family)